MNDKILFQSIAINALSALIASQTDDHRYVHQPNNPKEKQMVDDAMKIAKEMMKRLKDEESV